MPAPSAVRFLGRLAFGVAFTGVSFLPVVLLPPEQETIEKHAKQEYRK